MSQSSCNVCSYESFDSYNATLWAIRNPWFRNCSSLAGALGEQETQEASFQHPLAALGTLGLYQEPSTTPHDLGGDPDHGAGEVEPEPVPGPTTTDPTHDYYSGGVNPQIVADLQGEAPLFCRVGRCRYWHTDRKQIKRHRDKHFEHRFWWSCPNKTGSCKSAERKFRRKDAVLGHCKKNVECTVELEAGGKPKFHGKCSGKGDLERHDPAFHIPYRNFDGRTRRRVRDIPTPS